MPAPTDRNDRIALAKGWRRACYRQRTPHPNRCEKELGPWCETCLRAWAEWIDPAGKPAMRPDFVDTLEGVSGMLRELQEEQDRKNEARLYRTDARLTWSWTYLPCRKEYLCILENEVGYRYEAFVSPADRPGDCVGDAYLCVKEAADASTD